MACYYRLDNTSTVEGYLVNTSRARGPVDCSSCLRRELLCAHQNPTYLVAVPLIIAFGLVGNCLSVAVLRRERGQFRIGLFMQSLAMADNMYLLLNLVMLTGHSVANCTTWSPFISRNFARVAAFIWPSASFAQTTGVWTVTLLTADRYLAITRPLQRLRQSTSRRSVYCATGSVWVGALIYNLPSFFEFTASFEEDVCRPLGLVYRLRYRDHVKEEKAYTIVYIVVLHFVFRAFIPMLILLVLNYRLAASIAHARSQRHLILASTATSKRSDTLTATLVAVVTIFLCCSLPDVFVRGDVLFVKLSGISLPHAVTIVSVYTNMLLVINSAVNMFVYYLVRPKFRRILCTFFSRNATVHERAFYEGTNTRCRHASDTRELRGQSQSSQKRAIHQESTTQL